MKQIEVSLTAQTAINQHTVTLSICVASHLFNSLHPRSSSDSETVVLYHSSRVFLEKVRQYLSIACVHEFRSAVCSEVLPLVEFYLEDDISDEEAVSLIDLEVPRVERNSSGGNVTFTRRGNTGEIGSNMDALLCTSMT